MRDASQDEREATFKFIEEVHNCPAVWNVSSVAFKDSKNKQKNGGASGQTGFRPNLSISQPLSVSSLLFFCYTVVRNTRAKRLRMRKVSIFKMAVANANFTTRAPFLS